MSKCGADWGVIFDVDGTMVDNVAYHRAAWLEYGRRHGLPITPEFYRAHMHSRSNDVIARFLLGEDAPPEAAMALGDEKEEIYRELYRPHIRGNPGLHRLLEALSEEGVPCAAASNSPARNVEMILAALNVRAYFHAVVSLNDVARGKPHPDLLFAAAARLELPMGRCLVIEDSMSGFQAAEAAGAPYIAISIGADPESPALARQALAVHHDFTTLDATTLHRYACAGGGPKCG